VELREDIICNYLWRPRVAGAIWPWTKTVQTIDCPKNDGH